LWNFTFLRFAGQSPVIVDSSCIAQLAVHYREKVLFNVRMHTRHRL